MGWAGRAQGYQGMDPQDQAMVVRLVQNIINQEGSMTNPNAVPYVYVAGGNLMALAAYVATGGPDEVGAPVTVTQAIANGVVSLTNTQMANPNNMGGWNYGNPGPSVTFRPRSSRSLVSLLQPISSTVQTRPCLRS